MSSIKGTIEQFAGLYQELENNRFQNMINCEITRFNEIVSPEINNVLMALINEDKLEENFVVEVMTTPSGLYLILLKTPLLPDGQKIVEFDSPLPLKYLREELKKAHGKEKKDFDSRTSADVYRYTFNFPKIAK